MFTAIVVILVVGFTSIGIALFKELRFFRKDSVKAVIEVMRDFDEEDSRIDKSLERLTDSISELIKLNIKIVDNTKVVVPSIQSAIHIGCPPLIINTQNLKVYSMLFYSERMRMYQLCQTNADTPTEAVDRLQQMMISRQMLPTEWKCVLTNEIDFHFVLPEDTIKKEEKKVNLENFVWGLNYVRDVYTQDDNEKTMLLTIIKRIESNYGKTADQVRQNA